MSPEKASLTPYTSQGNPDEDKKLFVHFNPESLRISRRAQVAGGNPGTGNKDSTTVQQATQSKATGYSATLSVELLFDTTDSGDDVLAYTEQIAAMVSQGTPGTSDSGEARTRVRFLWGTLMFKGTIDSMEETVDYFSEEGKPLRSTVSLSMSEVGLERLPPKGAAAGAGAGAGFGAGFSAGFSASAGVSAGIGGGISAGASFGAGAAVGTTPLSLAQSGQTLQDMAQQAGADWKAVAELNGIDNPRHLEAGAVVNLNAGASASASFG
ncbi:MAG: LysM peptidoglycan-binding domain-containing protein [Caldilineae bacterium]|nr:LysM peptidoglycan-binding domain-containing protein [Anaerolineae bacterium]MCB9153378.1 LysM peptidoglycan-binding domain-containing protein [Caldilineae bacterium]